MNNKNENGETPLHITITPTIIQLLIDNKADINAINNMGDTPLNYAIDEMNNIIYLTTVNKDNNNFEEMFINKIKLLLENKADINKHNNKKNTPLHISASGSNKNLIQILLNNNADINLKNNDGDTPLHLLKNPKFVSIFKTNINIKNNNGETPLIKFIYLKNVEMVKSLIENNADVNIPNKFGETSLDLYNNSKDIFPNSPESSDTESIFNTIH